MKPWCAEGDVPTAANLNLYRGRSSYVVWHSDDEPLFGEQLIVSVSFGTQALFKWKGKSCPNNDGHSWWLGHGNILFMDGQCQDEFHHRTDPGREQDRINITFRWIKQHVASCSFLKDRGGVLFANVCVGFIFSCCGRSGEMCILEFLGAPYEAGVGYEQESTCQREQEVIWFERGGS